MQQFTQYQVAQWARQIKEFDGGKCVLCGSEPDGSYEKRLEAHHIKPQSLFPDMAIDLANGVALCHKCHERVTRFQRDGREYPPLAEYLEQHIPIVVPKELKGHIEAHAKSKGESVNGFINALLRDAAGLSESEWKANVGDDETSAE